MQRITVMGAGSWGTTMAKVIADGGTDVTLWARRPEIAAEIMATGRNGDYLPGIDLPKNLFATGDLDQALRKADQVYLAVPSTGLRENLENWRPWFTEDVTLVSLIKGLERESGLRMSQVIEAAAGCGGDQIAVLSGPNLALEIAQRQPAASVAACVDQARAEAVALACTNDYFTVFTNQDVIGTELGGVLKNLIAVAIGIVNGLGHGQNTKASIMTRGLAEITRFAVEFGAKRETMFGLAGLGDLIATSESTLSRNHQAGEMLGRGYSRAEVLKRMSQTAEGLSSVAPVLQLAASRGLEMPIVSQVNDVLEGRMPARSFGRSLGEGTELSEV
jgi:glycerol-3-phosphate dehydrogenase (NAD(P)+)